jgi:hypothetical protein
MACCASLDSRFARSIWRKPPDTGRCSTRAVNDVARRMDCNAKYEVRVVDARVARVADERRTIPLKGLVAECEIAPVHL